MQENKVQDIIDAQNGNKDKMAKLVEENNGLIWSIVKRFTGRGYEIEDLYQIGCIGFIKSIRRFNTDFDVKLSTYAVPYILGEIKRYIRDDEPIKVSRSLKELNVKILELQKEYMNKNGKELNLMEISKMLKVPKEEIAMAMEASKPVNSIEDANYTDNKSDKTINILEKLSNGKDEATSVANNITIKQLISNLDDRQKEIIMLRFYKDKTQTEVARILGVSQVQVSRLEKNILKSMREKLAI